MDLVRIATAGSVDDGKSTLIGRLLYDSKAIHDDVLDATIAHSQRSASEYLNLALLTDGLRAEREQGITIDVAYRYFGTDRREFVMADTPGHVQYTRNMVTGASTAQIALLIVDVRNGMQEQSRRHLVIAALLGIEYVVICVNKMDLVQYSRQRFDDVSSEFVEFLAGLGFTTYEIVPISALEGDNVVKPSENMDWFEGSPLLEHLETLDVRDTSVRPLRLPVQYTIRPTQQDFQDFRGYAGTIASGSLHVGDRVKVLPTGVETTVEEIYAPKGAVESAAEGTAVTVRIADDLAISRGDMIASGPEYPALSDRVSAVICWMDERNELTPGTVLRIKHTTRTGQAIVKEISAQLDVTHLEYEQTCASLSLNEIGKVELQLGFDAICDDYRQNRSTGNFILIDPVSNETVAAGMIGAPRFSPASALADKSDQNIHKTLNGNQVATRSTNGHKPAGYSPKVSIVVPTYNEAENLPVVVNELLSLKDVSAKLVIVDDGSPDGTGEIADRLSASNPGAIEVIHRKGKLGLGTAYIAGFQEALKGDSDYVVQMDADLSHPPSMVLKLVEALKDSDVAVASRYVEGGGFDPDWGRVRKLVSRWGGIGIRLVLGIPVDDVTSGFKAFRRSALQAIDLDRLELKGFGFQSEVAYRCHEAGLQVAELPFTFVDRQVGKSKMSAGIAIEAFYRLTRLRILGHA